MGRVVMPPLHGVDSVESILLQTPCGPNHDRLMSFPEGLALQDYQQSIDV